MAVPSIVLVLFMVHLKELLTHAILLYTNAATVHALSMSGHATFCQAQAGPPLQLARLVASQVWWAYWVCLSSPSLCSKEDAQWN